MPGALTSAKEVQDATEMAWAEGKHLLLVFGAPWCPNCAPFKRAEEEKVTPSSMSLLITYSCEIL